MNKINFLRGLLTISSLDKDLTAEIEKLKKYYLEVNYSKEKNELVNSVFDVNFDINDAKNNFDNETKELFFNSAILISEIQLNKEKKDDLVLKYAKKLDFDVEKLNSIKDNLKKELAKNLDFTPFNWLCRMIKGYFLFKETLFRSRR